MTNDFTNVEDSSALPQRAAEFHAPAPSIPSAPATLAEAVERLDVETAKRLHAEELLRETEERFRNLSERTGKFLWISDPQTNELIYVSPGYEEVWARTREGSYSSPTEWADSFKRSGRTTVLSDTAQREQTYQVAGPDGEARWIRDRMFPIRDAAGNVQRILGIAEDVTEAKVVHETLARTAAHTKALLAIVPDLLFRLRKDGTVLEFHTGKDNPFVVPEANLVGKNIKHLLSTQLATQAMQQLSQALRTREVQTLTSQYLLPNELRDFEARAVVCAEDEVLVIVRDVTERKRMEREIVEVSSREQQRIGEDLHDGLGQHLTGITFLTKALERRLTAKSLDEAKEAAEIGRLVIQALAQTRNLARGLFPAELERNGLIAALRELTESVTLTCGVRCALRANEKISVHDNVLATHLFRIAQEAINNSVKHGQAKSIEVVLELRDDKIELVITDNGVGIGPELKFEGLGLRIMNYRARRIGGELRVTNTDQGGTRVACTFRNKYESN
ncbi:MAG TPA: PAS domain-containing protein [Candidatus Limnocylindria bacterium]|nr:PAS domain-containing protein [Candidatus Limnocylindria bacterium]